MPIIIHQAICGEKNKAWDLIDTTLDDQATAKKIAFKTDLQDSPPSGINWSPIIRGFAYEQFYLLIKTYIDSSPDVRKGRVFSHCLIMQKDDLSAINDITSLFRVFKTEMDKTLPVAPFSYNTDDRKPINLTEDEQLRFNRVIKDFLHLDSCHNTVVWTGKESYELAVGRFWQLLDPAQKNMLNFGTYFTPIEIPTDRLNFITVPESIEIKFDKKGYCLVSKSEKVVLSEFAEQYLAGNMDFENRLKAFAKEFEFRVFGHKDIPIIAKGVNTFENLKDVQDIRSLNTFANIVARYSIEETKGQTAKGRLIAQLLNRLKNADSSEIQLLKNFPINSFKNSQEKLTSATVEWIEKHALTDKATVTSQTATLIVSVLDSRIPNWWNAIFESKVRQFFGNVTIKSARVFWELILVKNDVILHLFPFLELTEQAEENLIKALPKKLPNDAIAKLKPLLITSSWLKLYALLSKQELDFEQAIAAQLLVDQDQGYTSGLTVLIERQPEQKVIEVAVNSGDDRLINIAARLATTNPKLLANIDVAELQWQKLWSAATSNGIPIGKGLTDPKGIIFSFLDLIVKGSPYNERLLHQISDSDFSNILQYGNRKKIWSKFPNSVKDKFLIRTSSVFLQELAKNSTVPVPDDRELTAYIRTNAIATFLYYNRGNIKSALPIFTAYSEIPDQNIQDYIKNYSGSIDVVDATQLGRLALERRSAKMAYAIYDKTSSHKNFKIALGECYSLLDFITKGIAWASGAIKHIEVSADEWWSAFTELTYKLYSGGPTENKIWKQADGEEYDLQTKGTGKEVWIAALQKLRSGGCMGITTKKLLKKMIAEHKRSDELKTLKELYYKI